MERCVLLILITVPGAFADSIEPKDKANIIRSEGESVTLSCTYDTSSTYAMLYWYRQFPNREPQYLLRKGARSWNTRFQSITSQTSTELTIDSVTLSDSALYYCALSVGAQ
uniref:T-cell receptor alpha/delta variable 23.1.3 n=1 Tax=Cyprinus carpio TaxID=7962 RepID=A0A8C2F336_CYPCA